MKEQSGNLGAGQTPEVVPPVQSSPETTLETFLNSRGQASAAMETLGDFEMKESGRRGNEIYFKGTRKYGDGFEAEIIIRRSSEKAA
ncbi:hypothetical protein EPO05_03565 [Patescibacteria group bacterium]|nr:MAG: hypothetical protein EPO05_03565 [Patescibacteria group bacterium]